MFLYSRFFSESHAGRGEPGRIMRGGGGFISGHGSTGCGAWDADRIQNLRFVAVVI